MSKLWDESRCPLPLLNTEPAELLGGAELGKLGPVVAVDERLPVAELLKGNSGGVSNVGGAISVWMLVHPEVFEGRVVAKLDGAALVGATPAAEDSGGGAGQVVADGVCDWLPRPVAL
jgi:hypothetical protein